MPKTGLKTFVYSFSSSLFMIFTINGVFWHANHSSDETKIPHKNIMLFLGNPQVSPSTKPAPTKKIKLTKLDDIPTQAEDVLSPQIVYHPEESQVILADVQDPPQEIILADVSVDIPLAAEENTIVSPEKTLTKETSTPSKSQVSQKTLSLSNIAKVSKKPDDIIQIPATAPQILPSLPTQKNIVVAETSKVPEAPLLLPLQKDNNAPAQDKYQVRKSSEATPNRVALADKNVSVSGMISSTSTTSEAKASESGKWKSLSEQTSDADSPWVVAHSAGVHKNTLLKDEQFYKENAAIADNLDQNSQQLSRGQELLLASETVKNLLIPIPEDILNDEDLTPRLVSPATPEGLEQENAINEQLKKKKKAPKEASLPSVPSKTEEKTPIPSAAPQQDNKKKSLLSSLSNIFQAAPQEMNNAVKIPEENSGLIQDVKKKIRRSKGKIMPTEMRLSFQPNRAEISGQTLRWVQAFAAKAADDEKTGIEIRIDGTKAMRLQQKRLNLLHNILASRGVPSNKINTVFTDREPNSFIIRTMTLSYNAPQNAKKSPNPNEGRYLQW